MFKCSICGSNSYTKVLSEIFKCDGCSVLFSDPNMFSKKEDKQEFKAAGFSFAKLTDDAKERQAAIVANNYMSLNQGAN